MHIHSKISRNSILFIYVKIKDIFLAIFKTLGFTLSQESVQKCADLVIFQNPLNY